MQNHSPLIVIMGPTASGKSELAMKVAQELPCEIISADSMQAYREMDIGTSKPTEEEQALVKHHLIDILDIQEKLDVYLYVDKAKEAIDKIHNIDKTPLIVGGTGMYIRALLYGLDPLPASKKLQIELTQKYGAENGKEQLVQDLSILDPEAAHNYKNNKRKLLRAMEVFKLTGKPITQQHDTWQNNKLCYPASVYFVYRERTELFKRIEQRTNTMLENGWIQETESLIKKGLLQTPTAKQAIGYNTIVKYLTKEIDYDTMKTRIISATKRYARRQETWFNNKHPEAKKILLTNNNLKNITNKILKHKTP